MLCLCRLHTLLISFNLRSSSATDRVEFSIGWQQIFSAKNPLVKPALIEKPAAQFWWNKVCNFHSSLWVTNRIEVIKNRDA